MTRFRKWLIHKLGGYTKEEEINLVPLYTVYNLDEYLMMKYSEKQIKEIVEEELTKKISKGIKPEFILDVSPINGKRIQAKIELPSKYVKGVEDDD